MSKYGLLFNGRVNYSGLSGYGLVEIVADLEQIHPEDKIYHVKASGNYLYKRGSDRAFYVWKSDVILLEEARDE